MLIAYNVIHQSDATELLHTTSGRRELKAFVATQLFPRLQHSSATWMEDEDEDTTTTCTSQIYSYLQNVYFGQGRPPGHRWTQGGVSLFALSYLLHPDRGIDQGDTPSTLIFIAVFDILLTQVENSRTGQTHAYADDVVHLAPSLDHQHRQADLVCGFCAFTGLEIFLVKVEAISVNYGNILYETPYLILHDWRLNSHAVQHQDDRYCTRYLDLFLDQDACSRHFSR